MIVFQMRHMSLHWLNERITADPSLCQLGETCFFGDTIEYSQVQQAAEREAGGEGGS